MAGNDLVSLAEGIVPPAQGGPGAAGVAGGNDPLATRVRGWYLSDLRHPLWSDYIKQSAIDRAYYVGGPGKNQWLDDEGNSTDYDLLRDQKRATVSINQIKPIVKVLTGLERQTRFDLSVLPQGEEDESDAKVMSWLFKFVQTQAHIPEYRSIAFKQKLIEGMALLWVEIDYLDEPVTGDILIRVGRPGRDCLWDPYWERPDLSDANHVIEFRWTWVDEVVAQYPDHEEAIRGAVSTLNELFAVSSTATSSIRGDNYGSVLNPPNEGLDVERLFYDPMLQRVLVITAWYTDYETVWFAHDSMTGEVTEVPDQKSANALAASDPERLTAIRKIQRKIRQATVLPATYQVLEDGPSQYDNDDQAFPCVIDIGERVDDDIRGIVRDLRDPQRVENKRISQALDLVTRWSKIRRRAVENSTTPQTLATLDDPLAESTIWYKQGFDPPSWDIPAGLPELARLLAALADTMKQNIREISGINTDLLGMKDDTSSGIAIARRQAQGQVISTEYFDNSRWTGEILGQRLGRRIQQKFTRDELVRLTNDMGAPVLVHLNPMELRKLDKEALKKRRMEYLLDAQKPPILRDVSKFKYDLVMSETPATPTARAQGLEVLMRLVERAPALLPVMAPYIIKLTDGLPNKEEILQALSAMMGQAGAAGAPPGAPPAAGGAPPPLPPGGQVQQQPAIPTPGTNAPGVPETPQTVAAPPPGVAA